MRKTLRAAGAVLFGLWILLAAGCGGGGGGGDAGSAAASNDSAAAPAREAVPQTGADLGTVAAPTAAGVAKLFVADRANGVIATFESTAPAGSSLDQAPLVQVPGVTRIAYDDTRDILYASSGLDVVLVFRRASRLGAQPSASRTIRLPAGAAGIVGLHLDEENDVLYVGAGGTHEGRVFVFSAASSESAGATPNRTLTLSSSLNAMAIDTARALLYATDSSPGVLVYPGLDSVDGAIRPARRVLTNASASSLAIDATRDRLYLADVFAGVHVVDGMSQVEPFTPGPFTGPTFPPFAATIAIANAFEVAVDAGDDRLYVGAYDKGYVLEGASRLQQATPAPAVAVVGPEGAAISGFAYP